MKKILAIAMVLGVFGVIMGGCNKSDESGTTTSGSTATAGSTAGTAGSTADTTTK